MARSTDELPADGRRPDDERDEAGPDEGGSDAIGPSGSDAVRRAREVLLAFLLDREAPTDDELLALVDAHGDLRDELASAVQDWRLGARRLRDAASDPGSTEAVGGAGGGTGGDATGDSSEFSRALRRRLSHQGDRGARYRDVEEVARGGMGRVLRAYDADLRRTLALKILRDDRCEGETEQRSRFEARFVEEAQVTAQLDHPGIVPVHDIGLDSRGHVYFTMKLVKGSSLAQLLDRGVSGAGAGEETSLPRLLGVLLKVCEAMAYAHEKRVIHRDLKPSNVMVGRFGEVYVMDFGLARVLGQEDPRDLRIRRDRSVSLVESERATAATAGSGGSPLVTMDGAVVGTPAYMPPEQARGELEAVGPRSDVYGVGAMLYHALAGHAPYGDRAARDAQQLLDMVVEEPPTPIETLAPGAAAELIAICDRAMRRDARDRYATMQELADDLRAFLEDRVVRAHATGAVVELRKWVRRNRALAAACAALLVVLIGGSLSWAWMQHDRNTRLARAFAETQRERAARGRLADVMTARDLLRDEATHGPDVAGIARMERFLARLDDIEGRRTEHAETVRSGEGVDPELRDELAGLLRDLDRLAPVRDRVERRLAAAKRLRRESIEDHASTWARAISAVQANPRYHGLLLQPQLGLVPLRENPDTGLWEFWLVLSGSRPDPDHPAEDSGMVLVLLPGGKTSIGSPPDEPDRDWNETQHDVVLPAFFLSRFEATQAQFLRATGENPSWYPPGAVKGPTTVTLLHPVERVTFRDAEGFANVLGLRLPTEEEWEYACRGFGHTAYPHGPTQDSLEGAENVRDAAFYALRPDEACAPWDDGFPIHAPVGSLRANSFGLFDIGGNVSEWTSSLYEGDYVDPEPPLQETRVVRGGLHYGPPRYARTANRQPFEPTNAQVTIGIRLARSLDTRGNR